MTVFCNSPFSNLKTFFSRRDDGGRGDPMTLIKRTSAFMAAVVLSLSFVLGSLSFIPKSFAVSDKIVYFDDLDSFDYCLAYYFESTDLVSLFCFNFSGSPSYFYNCRTGELFGCAYAWSGSSSGIRFDFDSSGFLSGQSSFRYTVSGAFGYNAQIYSVIRSNAPSSGVYCCGVKTGGKNFNQSTGGVSGGVILPEFNLEVKPVPKVISSIPHFFDYSPFYFPELPHGEFDGNINVVDGTYNIDFPSNASIDGSMTVVPGGGDQYTWTLDGDIYWWGEDVQGQLEGWIDNGSMYGDPTGTLTGTIVANRDISLSLSNLDSVVNYTPAYNENSRFRCWSCVMDSSYCWFISDTRNKINGRITSVTADSVSWEYVLSDPQGGNTIYPSWAVVFSPMGEVIQVLSPVQSANTNTYGLSCTIGTLEQDQDTGIWSCDPLYHGFWFSNDSPPVANITHLNVAENKKYLANPVFGEAAFTFNFLDSINRNISGLRSDLTSLQSAMTSSISGQTDTIMNTNVPNSNPADVTNMTEYESVSATLGAPNTNSFFDLDGNPQFWDGMTFWRRIFDDVVGGNQVLVAYISFVLTIGLAVFIIGRRVNTA